MPRKAKIEPIASRRFMVLIKERAQDGVNLWCVRSVETQADTEWEWDLDAYRKLKKTWRKSKKDFDDICKWLNFHNLFSQAGIQL